MYNVDISPNSPDFSCTIACIPHDVFLYKSNKRIIINALSSSSQSEQPSSPLQVSTVALNRSHRFLRRQLRWSTVPISLKAFRFVNSHSQRL